jgi:hypothetical protein
LSDNPLLEQLGYAPDARLVIFHADDVGMCHGANQAFLDLQAAAIVRTGSVMTPCPWSEEILRAAAADPALDLGVHLTLNSEWTGYRWGPLSTRDPASGLVDGDGWFWPRPPATLEHLNVAAAVAELRAQIAFVQRAGLDFTHIDAHMGAALSGPLLEASLQLGFEHRVPVLFPREPDDYVRSLLVDTATDAAWRAQAHALEAQGMPLVDTFRITPGYDPFGAEGGQATVYEQTLHELPSGVTYFSLHPNAPGEIEALAPINSHWRTFEHTYFQSQRLRDFLMAEGIIPIGMRALRDVMRH